MINGDKGMQIIESEMKGRVELKKGGMVSG